MLETDGVTQHICSASIRKYFWVLKSSLNVAGRRDEEECVASVCGDKEVAQEENVETERDCAAMSEGDNI